MSSNKNFSNLIDSFVFREEIMEELNLKIVYQEEKHYLW
jgi:hypothetical protein